MSNQSELGVKKAGEDRLSLPAYAVDLSATSSQESRTSLDYESQKSESMSVATTSSPIYPFPAVMNAYAQWGQFKSFNICGEKERDQLFNVEVHTGYSGKKPLGTRPGMLLYNGTSSKGPVLAAVGDESQLDARVYAFNLESVILMAPLQHLAHVEDQLITERMHARTSGDHVAFFFSIDIGHGEKLRREDFEWRKIKKGVDDEVKEGGFKLVRLSSPSQTASSGSSDSSISRADGDGEIVALIMWKKMLASLKHMFTLRLVGSGASGELGDRWALVVVVTSLRLWQLKLKGRTSKGVITMGEKIRGK